eukprot:COSAG01_NODE_1330_length_10699_cov_49.561604_7_plen_44_part_00
MVMANSHHGCFAAIGAKKGEITTHSTDTATVFERKESYRLDCS